jgi:hypothetical protein
MLINLSGTLLRVFYIETPQELEGKHTEISLYMKGNTALGLGLSVILEINSVDTGVSCTKLENDAN